MNPLLKALSIEVREFCVDNFVLKQIDEIFVQGDFQRQDYSSSYPRRSLVEDYYRSMDWEQKDTIDKFYQVIINILKMRWLSDESRNDLIDKCRELGFNVQNYDQFYSSARPYKSTFSFCVTFKANWCYSSKTSVSHLKPIGVTPPKSQPHPQSSHQRFEPTYKSR